MAKRLIFYLFLAVTAGLLILIKNSPLWQFGKINLALLGDESVSVFSLEGKDSGLLEFSPKEKVGLPRGFGQYELGKVYRLGELEKKGGRLSLETFQHSLGLPVVGYFYQDSFNADNFVSPADFRKIVGKSMTKNIKTDFSLIDLLVLYFRGKKSSGLAFKKDEYKNGLHDFFKDGQIRREALALEILNGTPHQGLAQKAAVIWENMGGRVIRVADYDKQLAGSLLIIRRDLIKSYSYKIINYFFKPSLRETDGEENRADMTLIVGEDYWKIMTEKW